MHDPWTERLSDYLDGELEPQAIRPLEDHLSGCATCAAVLADLRRVADRARELGPSEPASDLWPLIAARIAADAASREDAGSVGEVVSAANEAVSSEPATRARTLRFPERRAWWSRQLSISLPQALAASLLLVALSGGLMWSLLQRGGMFGRDVRREPMALGAASHAPISGTGPNASAVVLASMDPRYDRTVAELQQVLVTQRSKLDTSTVRILEQNLAIIDRAVADARRAVDSDPSNSYLRAHLASTMKRKVDLLRRATVIASARG